MTFAVSGHRRRLRLAIHGAALVLWAIGEVALVAAWIKGSPHAPLPLVVLWTLAGVALLWNGGRRGAGRETLTVTPAELVHRRGVGPFQFTRRYPLERIAQVHNVRLPGLASDRYQIEFTYDGRPRHFGHNLSSQEAACIVGLIRGSTAGVSGQP